MMMVKVTPEDLKNAREHYEMSKKDMEAAKILYERGLYPLAIFHAQQSVEKMLKSFLLNTGVKKSNRIFDWSKIPGNDDVRLRKFLKKEFGACWIENAEITKIDSGEAILLSFGQNSIEIRISKERDGVIVKTSDGKNCELEAREEEGELNIYEKTGEVKGFGHRLLEMEIEILEVARYARTFASAISWLPKATQSEYLNRINKNIEKLEGLSTEEGRKKLFAISTKEDELKKQLMEWDEIQQKLARLKKAPVNFKKLRKIKNAPPELLQFLGFTQQLSPQDRDFLIKSIAKSVRPAITCFPYLAGFAAIFYPHVALSRYPDKGHDPLNFYTSELPLVKMLPEFFKRMENAVRNFDEYQSCCQELQNYLDGLGAK